VEWQVPQQKLRSKGDSVGGAYGKNSYYVKVFSKQYTVSHIIIEMHLGRKLESGEVVDHIDGNNRNNNLSNLRVVDSKVNNRNVRMSVDNTSGAVGVNKQHDSYGKAHWITSVYNLQGKRVRKSFSIDVYGDNAFVFACNFRNEQIRLLNEQGAGYSERHGK